MSASVTIGTGGVAPSVGMPIQGKNTSTTFAAVSPGTIVVRSGATDLSGLSRDTAHANNGIGNGFDLEKIQETKELVDLAGQEGFKAVGDLSQHFTKEYDHADLKEKAAEEYRALLAKGDSLTSEERGRLEDYQRSWGFTPGSIDDEIADARATKAFYQEQYDTWKDGSPLKTALHAAVGGIQAGLGGGSIVSGALGAGASEALSPVTAELPRSVRPFASLGIGAVAGGLAGGTSGGGRMGAITGGSSAEYGYQFNRRLHDNALRRISDLVKRMEAEGLEKYGFKTAGQALSTLLTAACGLVQCAAEYASSEATMHAWQAAGESPEMEKWRKLLLAEGAGTDDFTYTYTDWLSDRSKRMVDETAQYLSRKRAPGVRPRLSTFMLTRGEQLEATPEQLYAATAGMRRADVLFNPEAAYGAVAGVVRFGENLSYLFLDAGMAIGGDLGPSNSALNLVEALKKGGLRVIPEGIIGQITLAWQGDAVTFGELAFGATMAGNAASNIKHQAKRSHTQRPSVRACARPRKGSVRHVRLRYRDPPGCGSH